MKTNIDRLIELLSKSRKERLRVKKISKALKWDVSAIEKVVSMLEKYGIVNVIYPVNPLSDTTIQLAREEDFYKKERFKKKAIEQYNLNVDGVPAQVNIYYSQKSRSTKYYMEYPQASPYTRIFIEELKNEIIKEVPIEIDLITDVEKAIKVKREFHRNIKNT